jgi:hypothetical protein
VKSNTNSSAKTYDLVNAETSSELTITRLLTVVCRRQRGADDGAGHLVFRLVRSIQLETA